MSTTRLITENRPIHNIFILYFASIFLRESASGEKFIVSTIFSDTSRANKSVTMAYHQNDYNSKHFCQKLCYREVVFDGTVIVVFVVPVALTWRTHVRFSLRKNSRNFGLWKIINRTFAAVIYETFNRLH